MKKYLIGILVLLMPLMVFAKVDEDTQTTQWEVASNSSAESLCRSEESKNVSDELKKATSGYYLYCIEISCDNGTVSHKATNPLSDMLVCSNGNTNPKYTVSSSGALDEALISGATCSQTGTFAYATEKLYYNCGTLNDGNDTPYNSTTTKSTTKNNSGDDVESPQTGVEDYIIPLSAAFVALMFGLYALNKKNVFKKI